MPFKTKTAEATPPQPQKPAKARVIREQLKEPAKLRAEGATLLVQPR